jgi:signal transduction histidine kinase
MSILAASADITPTDKNILLNETSLAPLISGDIVVTQGKLGDIFAETQLIVGYPIKRNETVIFSILMNSPLTELNKTIWDMYRATGICLIVAVMVGFVLIYISSRTISKPLLQMNEAAKQIASGDFEKRVEVSGRDEVSELAASLNDMAESLYLQEKTRRDFIANISHDLRSPLTSMRGFLEAVIDGIVAEDKIDHYLSIVLDETDRLSKLADNVMDLSQIQTMNFTLNTTIFDINALIRKVALRFETRVKAKGLELRLSFANESDRVEADYEKIQRVIYNLVDNAVKFTPEKGRVEIETNIIDGKVLISIRDNGCGIEAEAQKKIFDRFFKADVSRGEDKKGSGLGLSIVREFVKAHGESIHLRSVIGEGSLFTFGLTEVKNDEQRKG